MKLSSLDRDGLIALISEMELPDLLALEMALKVAIRMQNHGTLSTDREDFSTREEEGPALHDEAREILADHASHELTLADQALLASLILSDAYQQDTFSSRAINDVIYESGGHRIVHITSAIQGLKSRNYLNEEGKSLSLSREGRVKARALIGLVKRRAAAA